MASEYKTIASEGYYEFVEKHSRFIGTCKHVTSESEANEFISKIKNQYKDASHNVYAYYLKDGNLSRCTDDGEPSGTAGRQLLAALQGPEIFNAVIVVTRYFGGTLLGTGGLSRAYSQAAVGAVNNAGISIMTECASFSVKCSYSFYDQIIFILSNLGVKILDTSYSEDVKIYCMCKCIDLDTVSTELVNRTSGKVLISEPVLSFEAF